MAGQIDTVDWSELIIPPFHFFSDIASLLLWGGPIARGIGPGEHGLARSPHLSRRMPGANRVSPLAPRNEMKRMHRALEASQFGPLVDKVFEFDQLKEAYHYSLVVRVAKD